MLWCRFGVMICVIILIYFVLSDCVVLVRVIMLTLVRFMVIGWYV